MASLRRPQLASSTTTRRANGARVPPAPLAGLASSAASASTSSLLSPPLPGQLRRGDSQDVRQKRESTDGNIHVVVRCRGTSPSEVERGVRVVAEVKATRGTEVKLVDPNPAVSSSSGGSSSSTALGQAQTKTWDFGERAQEGAAEPRGTVYGPDADQGMLYNDVAKPILQQVLQGYNCTIFAYGQTGTGKTYTMEGNLSPYHGTFHPDAGVIPRTLYSLFDRLAESKCEYSVRCSFIELYNEELRDLNASSSTDSDLSSASSVASSPEPGAVPRANGNVAPKTLRIYEETKNGQTGVTIQGLEETFIQNAEEGLRVLRRGSERRQIASTNCNERSSRSHSIFTIHVHVKENGGTDVLKVGKLNLVDLAGSENVGRSGAVQGRAREAGMINASLLALGRVINQLVDKNDGAKKQHIAYRESKLTRLLQDSLGGRTKTTIIATISPVSYEETASTLSYAHQAKSIQNRPEVNQRVSRNVLLNQFVGEIERLKADLAAARGQHGVYVSQETWEELEAGRLSFDETKRKLEITESQLQTTRDQFEQNFRLLSTREEQLHRVKDELASTKGELEEKRTLLEDTRLRLAQQEVLRDAYEQSREGWKQDAGEALDDVEGLRAKLARKTAASTTNLSLLSQARSEISQRTKEIAQRTDELEAAQGEFVRRLGGVVDEWANRAVLHRSATSTLVHSHLSTLAPRLAGLAQSSRSSAENAGEFQAVVEETCAALFAEIEARSGEVERLQGEEREKVEGLAKGHGESLSALLNDLTRPVEQLREECRAILEQDVLVVEGLSDEEKRGLEEENTRLRALVASLQHSLATERALQHDEDASLLSTLQSALSAASARRLKALEESYASVEDELEQVKESRERGFESREGRFAGLVESKRRMGGRVEVMAEGVERAAHEGSETTSETLAHLSAATAALATTAKDARAEQLALLSTGASHVRAAGIAHARQARLSQLDTRTALEGLLEEVGGAAVDWERTAREAEGMSVEAAGIAERELDALPAPTLASLRSIASSSTSLRSLLPSLSTPTLDLPTGLTPAPRTRPVDRLLPTLGVDLDAEDRKTVLQRLLEARTEEVAATAAALDDGAEGGVHALAAAALPGSVPLPGLEASAPVQPRSRLSELQPTVAVLAPLPSAAVRASLAPPVGGKAELAAGGAGGRRKVPLGERDGNAPPVVRRVVRKPLAKAGGKA
ncbi:hypothetical protein JCM10213_005365 [Rhodosporidiobolus nylandii]